MITFLSKLKKIPWTQTAAAAIVLVLTLAAAPVWSAVSDFQQRTVKGRVTSADDGQGFPGVNIIIQGTTVGTVTDNDGNFSLEVNDANAVLVFTSIGYKTTEIPVAGQTTINLAMEPDVTSLAEVVVVGYGTVKKSDITGALSSVTSEQLRAVPVQSISQALQGRAAGVDVAQSSFRPGDNPTIRIRGNRSLIGSNDPLIVVDGIPLPEGSGINDFNPNDVESIEVLKDASSAAIYGSRGANGVILVTTKKGKPGKSKVTYEGYYGLSAPLTEIEMRNGGQHAELRREAYRNNAGLTYHLPWADVAADFSLFSPQDVELWNSVADGYEWVDREARIPVMRDVTADERAAFEAYYQQYLLRYPDAPGSPRPAAIQAKLNDLRARLDDPNLQVPVYDPSKVRTTDWGDLALQTGKKQSHQFSVSGGRENIGLFFGGGYYSDEGIQKSQAFERFNVKFGLDYQASDRLKVGGTLNGILSEQEFGSPLYFRAIGQIPLAIPYDASGNVILQPGGDALIFSPLNEIDDFVDDRRNTRFFGSYYLDFKIAEGLRFHVNAGTDFRHHRRGQYQGALTSDRRGGTSWANYYQDQRFTWVLENLLFYDKTFSADHRISATALFSLQEDRFESSGVNVANLPYESQLFYNLGSTNAAGPDAFSSDFSRKAFGSYMGRVNYSFKDRYLVTVTGRYDGLSPLASGNKWGFFPSASFAWKILQEPFMNEVTFLDELKLRVGYGEVGNAGVPAYLAPGRLTKVPYVWNETPAWGYIPQFIPNPSLSWEGTRSLNVGVDFAFFEGRIAGTIEGYQQNTDKLMMWRQLPTASGFSSILENIGKVRNTGIELSLNTVNLDLPNGFKWTSDIIFSKNKEELVELYGGTNDDLGNRWFIGHPITTYYDWQTLGVWQTNEADQAAVYRRIPGQGKIQDQLTVDSDGDGKPDAADGVINAADMVIRGSNVPDWTGSIVNTFSYKGVELSLMLYTRQGSMIGSGYYRPALAGRYPEPAFIDYWTPTNPTNAYPRPTSDQERIDYPEAYLYQDGSFVKLRNITLAYTFPNEMISRFRMSNLRVFATAYNPFLWTDFKGGDPEFYANATRVDRGLNVPITNVNDQLIGNNLSEKSIVFGLSVGF
ncbi:MAG TPA: TonB-dependent receptor [Chryseosolibacter sp.]|nr:TonB-dependent receptor [Chryseosolibacter sp.]